MKSDFIHLKDQVDGKEYYIDVNAESGAKIILPGIGTIALTADDVQKIVDFRAGFDYRDTVIRRSKVNSIHMDTLEYNVLNKDTNELVLVSFFLKTNIDQPDMKFETISVTNGKTAVSANLPFTVVDVLLREFASKGFVTKLAPIKDIRYVEKLPNETAADSNTVYVFENEYYKLNAAEDGFDKITGTFVEVNTLPEFTPKAKEGVLYNLTADFECAVDKEKYSKGVYTFANKKFTLSDLSISSVKTLPDLDKAVANTIYVLTKQVDDKAKGSKWVVKNNAWTEETREIITGATLPIIALAVPGNYYIVAGKVMQLATQNSFKKLGTILNVKALPDTTKITVEPDVVFVLTKAQGKNPVGSKFVFDPTKKEFNEYTEEVTGSGDTVVDEDENP